MNISFNWIEDLADLPAELLDPPALAERLTMTAAAVQKIEAVGAEAGGVRVARVLEAMPHPNADRLTLCTVDRGAGQVVEVVCGAPVIETGGAYPYVAPGEELPGGFRIESRKIRGRPSHGMLCSEAELRLGRDSGGIMRLADDLVPGTPLAEALGLPDTRFALDLNPNRVDLACHSGVAREVSSGGRLDWRDFGGERWSPRWMDGETEADGAGATVRIEDLERCPRYMAAVVRGVKVGPSPAWLAGRLLAAGARPISNVVDATNYVLLELNQPLHAFDLAKVEGREIRVRAARGGETLVTLDGERRKLSPVQTVIADRERAVALAGVMGGLDTEVTNETTDLLIECAAFHPAWVRKTSAGAGLATDASYRFERGIDVHAQERALVRCVELILATAGGVADAVGLRVGPRPPEPEPVGLRVDRVNQVLGFGLDADTIVAALEPVGFEPLAEADRDPGRLRLAVPGWRRDVEREIDLVEEVARRVGYDTPARRPGHRFRLSAVPEDPAVAQAARVRNLLVACGCLEARSLSFMPQNFRGNRAVVAVPNPLSAEESYLRSSMVPVLLRRLEHNFSRGNRDVRLFEIGTVFGCAGENAASEASTGASSDRPADGGADRPDVGADYPANARLRKRDMGAANRMSARVVADRPADARIRRRGEDAANRMSARVGGGLDRFQETARVGVVITGGRRPGHWSEEGADFDIWDLKAIADDFARHLCGGETKPWVASTQAAASPATSRQAAPLGSDWLADGGFLAERDGQAIGVAGAVKAASIDLPPWAAPVFAAEFSLDAVERRGAPVYAEPSSFPSVRRDLSVTLPLEAKAADVESALREAASGLLRSVKLFDVYSSEETGEGRRALGWTLRFCAPDRTLTVEEVESEISALSDALERRFDARIRGS